MCGARVSRYSLSCRWLDLLEEVSTMVRWLQPGRPTPAAVAWYGVTRCHVWCGVVWGDTVSCVVWCGVR